MKVILIKDVKNQGKKDDIKEVKNGYGEFLIKSGCAVQYTQKGLSILENEKQIRKEEETKIKDEALDLKKKLEKVNLVFKVKTGQKDKVFGNISSKQISEELSTKGFKIDKKKIVLRESLNSLGKYNIEIILHKEVSASIKVELVKQE